MERRARSSKAPWALLFPASRAVSTVLTPSSTAVRLAAQTLVALAIQSPSADARSTASMLQVFVGASGSSARGVAPALAASPVVEYPPPHNEYDARSRLFQALNRETPNFPAPSASGPWTSAWPGAEGLEDDPIFRAVDVDRPGLAGRDCNRRIQRNRELRLRPVVAARDKGAALHPPARVEISGAVLGPRRGADVQR